MTFRLQTWATVLMNLKLLHRLLMVLVVLVVLVQLVQLVVMVATLEQTALIVMVGSAVLVVLALLGSTVSVV